MLRLDQRLLWAVALGMSAGCASIDGSKPEPVDDMGPAPITIDGGQDAGGGSGDTNGNQNGNTNGPAADAGPMTDGGGSARDGGSTGEPDATTPPPAPADGTCAAPYPLTFASNKASVTGNTTGKAETLSPKCSPAGNLLGGAGIAGPDQVYSFTMPFKGKAHFVADGAGTFSASAYLLTQCGNSASEKACGFDGVAGYAAAKDTQLFVYIDSGATTPLLGAAPPKEGGFGLTVSLREEAEALGACGPAYAQPYCAAGTLCRNGACAAGSPSCGDTFVEGTEECDGTAGCTACKLNATREACATAGVLVLRPEADKLVGRAAGTTAGMVNDVNPSCTDGAGPDHIYSFTLAERSNVTAALKPTGFDAVLAISGTCGSGSIDCVDDGAGGGAETYTGALNAGTYFVTVDAYTTGSGAYELVITADPTP